MAVFDEASHPSVAGASLSSEVQHCYQRRSHVPPPPSASMPFAQEKRRWVVAMKANENNRRVSSRLAKVWRPLRAADKVPLQRKVAEAVVVQTMEIPGLHEPPTKLKNDSSWDKEQQPTTCTVAAQGQGGPKFQQQLHPPPLPPTPRSTHSATISAARVSASGAGQGMEACMPTATVPATTKDPEEQVRKTARGKTRHYAVSTGLAVHIYASAEPEISLTRQSALRENLTCGRLCRRGINMTDSLSAYDVGRERVWNQLGCPAPDKMPYCCVPRCKSSSKQRTPGISFHEIPSDPELRAKWLKVISRDYWTPNTTSCYSTVFSRHLGSSDFKEGCKIRKLKKDAVPSIFEEYPAYLQPPKNRERSDASVRKREAAAPVNTPPPKRRAVENQLESPSLPLNDLPSVDVASQELSLMDCSATELPLPLENGASERCITTTVQVDRAVQVSSLFSVSAMEKRKWRRKERDLNAPIERLKNTVDKYKQELQKLKEECYVSAFLQVVEKAKEKDLAASILVEQVQNFAKKKPTWSEVTVRHAVV
ncbi:hypothetical protein HPB49_002187 [Dermacentor silvarum]|uniref:Uncharacterized protein n=1 Tax=Dermacentor silvarum TaxID=543639 RepID=A0ACB8DST0_DERSI|nr:hypothetical protein HPB49_002187 [Dermacentor silvarum]